MKSIDFLLLQLFLNLPGMTNKDVHHDLPCSVEYLIPAEWTQARNSFHRLHACSSVMKIMWS